MSTRTIDFDLDLGDVGAFTAVATTIHEAISEPTSARVEIAANEDLDFSGLLAKDAVLSLLVDGFESRRWTLQVGKIAFLGVKQGSLRFEVELHPRFWLLRHTTATRKFRNLSNQQIISKILDEHQVKQSWKLTRQLEERSYVVQYRETAFDFVSRLLEFEGVYYSFDDDGTMVLADRSSASPTVKGSSYFELVDSAGALANDQLGVHEIARGAKIGSGAATVNDFNWKTPRAKLIKTEKAELDADLEVYDYPTGYRDPAQGALLAKLRLEALRVPTRYVEGGGNVASFAPAHLFTFGGAAGASFAGDLLLVEVDHRWKSSAFEHEGGDTHLYANGFHAIPRELPFRPRLSVPQPTVEGCHTAMVRGPTGEEIHTDKYGRFKAQFHWDREAKSTDEDSRWVRMLQETATSMTLARVDWEMHVAYIDGDPDRPVGIARNINGVMIPTYGQPANKTLMSIKTQTYPGGGGFNEFKMDDVAGSQMMHMKGERDLLGVVQNDKTETIGGNETRNVDQAGYHTVERDQNKTVLGSESITCTGSYQLAVTGDRTMSVGGDETIEIGTSQTATVSGDDAEDVTGARSTETKDEGSIGRTCEKHLTRHISGSQTITAKGPIEYQVGKEYKETVSGDKLTTVSEGGILDSVSDYFNLTIDGSVMRYSKMDMSVSAKESVVTIKAAMDLLSDEKIDVRGDVLELEARSSMIFSSGGLKIEMTPSKTTFTGDVRMETDNTIKFTGNPENVTK